MRGWLAEFVRLAGMSGGCDLLPYNDIVQFVDIIFPNGKMCF